MKKLFAILVGCLLVVTASAAGKTAAKKSTATSPISKGQWFFCPSFTNVGVNAVSLKIEGSSEAEKVSRFGLQGTGGYGLMDNLALEAGVGFQAGKIEGASASIFDLFAGARYYFFKNMYGNADLVFAAGKLGDGTSFSAGGKMNALQLQLGVGYDFMITDHFAFEPCISYALTLMGKVEDSKFKLGIFSINLGFAYFF